MPNLCHINSTRAKRWPHHQIVNLEPKLECRLTVHLHRMDMNMNECGVCVFL